MRLIPLAFAALLATGAHAGDIYKCPGADGKIEFRDRPCAGGTGEKLKPKDNSIGTGGSMAAIRAQDAEFAARQIDKQRAIDKANAAAYAAGERQWQQERAHQDSVDVANAIREGNGALPDGYYYYGDGYRRHRTIRVEVAPTPAPKPPPSVPAKPKLPNSP